jgi:hypothetical protein
MGSKCAPRQTTYRGSVAYIEMADDDGPPGFNAKQTYLRKRPQGVPSGISTMADWSF